MVSIDSCRPCDVFSGANDLAELLSRASWDLGTIE